MTHVVLTSHSRIDKNGKRQIFEPGSKITPTERELKWFGNKFKPIEGAARVEKPVSRKTTPREIFSEERPDGEKPRPPRVRKSTSTLPAITESDS